MTSKRLPRRIAVVALLPLLGVVLVPRVSANSPMDSPVSIYASAYGVSIDKAQRELDLQGPIGELDAELAAFETYAGLWIEHQPAFHVVAAFTKDGQSALDSSSAAPDVKALVELRDVPRSVKQLVSVQEALIPLGTKLRFSIAIDVVTNRVAIMPSIYTDRSALAGISLDDAVWVDPTDSRGGPTGNVYGGLNFDNDSGGCTVGFGVWINDLAVKGFVTAGHCGNTGGKVNGISTPYIAEDHYGSHDEQLHTAPNQTIRNWVTDNGSYHSITARRFRDNQALGSLVCKYGRTTHYGCGDLTNKNFWAYWVPNGASTYMRVDPYQPNLDLSSPGDSGGPVYYFNEAWGIVEGSWAACGCALIYTAINYVETGVGVRVLTS